MAELSGKDITLNAREMHLSSNLEPYSDNALIHSQSETNVADDNYSGVYFHWFYKKEVENQFIWQPLSMIDSVALESVFMSDTMSPEKVVATDCGRYDVDVSRRERYPVYWTSAPTEVRRCSWFYKSSGDSRYVPYEEDVAAKLEEEYKIAFKTKQWHRRVELANGESVVFHSPTVLLLLPPVQSPDTWGNPPQAQPKPRTVLRGMDHFNIEDGETDRVDHVLFLVHGIGSACDLKFRSVNEVVDDFRSISYQLTRSHYRSSCDRGVAGRIEVLPISWHGQLHSETTGIDKKLKSISLESIPRLRDFTNDTLCDILFYTSPIYCQTIISTVGGELNRIYALFKQRNPNFDGGVSLGGHSLGSLILFDLLCHQKSALNGDNMLTNTKLSNLDLRISYSISSGSTDVPNLFYPQLSFKPSAFFALGSPIGLFVTIRGVETLGEDFVLPTCPVLFNIFHPYDPVAFRIEPLINSKLTDLKPVLIPHHKGRKRMHLELKETVARVGADLKQKFFDTMKSTWSSLFQPSSLYRHERRAQSQSSEMFGNLAEEEATKNENKCDESDPSLGSHLGILNKGRRVDYVLQEAPFEIFNEYLFALTSHVGYWESEDTILLIIKEIYTSMGISTDIQIPQQTMTIERVPASPAWNNTDSMLDVDPSSPIEAKIVDS